MDCLTLIIAFHSTCAAYGDTTHRNIVRDAFEFMIANKNDSTTTYSNGSTPKIDYHLLTKALSGTSGMATDQTLRRIAKTLGEESVNTDRLPDVALTVPWYALYKERTNIAGISFTAFSHFINARMGSVFWEQDGYSYENGEVMSGVRFAI